MKTHHHSKPAHLKAQSIGTKKLRYKNMTDDIGNIYVIFSPMHVQLCIVIVRAMRRGRNLNMLIMVTLIMIKSVGCLRVSPGLCEKRVPWRELSERERAIYPFFDENIIEIFEPKFSPDFHFFSIKLPTALVPLYRFLGSKPRFKTLEPKNRYWLQIIGTNIFILR